MIERIEARAARFITDAPRSMLVTDLDGTLLSSARRLEPSDRTALQRLGAERCVRVVATGRNLYSYQRAVDDAFPVDFVVFSSGAGVLEVRSGEVIRTVSLEDYEVREAATVLIDLALDFMIHRPIPDNHHFAFLRSGANSPEFRQRIDAYREYARPIQNGDSWSGEATQLLAIEPANGRPEIFDSVRKQLARHSVIRSTSPMDGVATWVEVFAKSVSKSLTARWLSEELGVSTADVLAVGNDYNDLDLLDWAGTSYVVANAPQDLRDRFAVVASNDHGGVGEAVRRWAAVR